MGAAMLTDDQKRTQLDISRYLLSPYEDDPGDFIKLVQPKIRHAFTTLTQSKMQSKQWKHTGSTPPKKFKMVRSAGKVMASIFWDSHWVIMIDYLEQGCMINSAYLLCRQIEVATPGNCKKEARKTDLRCSARAGQCPCPRGFLLLQDNAHAHVVFCSCRTMPLSTHHKLS